MRHLPTLACLLVLTLPGCQRPAATAVDPTAAGDLSGPGRLTVAQGGAPLLGPSAAPVLGVGGAGVVGNGSAGVVGNGSAGVVGNSSASLVQPTLRAPEPKSNNTGGPPQAVLTGNMPDTPMLPAASSTPVVETRGDLVGLALGGPGQLLAVDGISRVLIVDAQGGRTPLAGSGVAGQADAQGAAAAFAAPACLVADPAGGAFVGDGGGVRHVDPKGRVVTFVAAGGILPEPIVGLALDGTDVLVLGNTTLVRATPQGGLALETSGTPFSGASGLARAADGAFLVADQVGGRVMAVAKGGGLSTVGTLVAPIGLVADATGGCYVVAGGTAGEIVHLARPGGAVTAVAVPAGLTLTGALALDGKTLSYGIVGGALGRATLP